MKTLIAIALLALTGCVYVPAEPDGYTRVIAVDPVCCVWYGGFYGFWYGGRFYDHDHYRRGFRGGSPYRFEGDHRWEGNRR